MHVGADPALCGWHKPRHCFVERHLGVFRAAAMLSTGFLELSALQAVLKWAGWSSSTDRKGILLWHTVPLQWELALGKDPPWCWIDPWEQLIQNHNVLVQHLAAEWLVDQPWHYLFFLLLYLLFSEYVGWIIIQCVLCIAESRNICFGFSSWLVRVCGCWARSHGIVSDYVNEIFKQENNEYRPENKVHPVAISHRQFFLLKSKRASATVIIYMCT